MLIHPAAAPYARSRYNKTRPCEIGLILTLAQTFARGVELIHIVGLKSTLRMQPTVYRWRRRRLPQLKATFLAALKILRGWELGAGGKPGEIPGGQWI